MLTTALSILFSKRAEEAVDADAAELAEECTAGGGNDDFLNLRIASIFVILVGSMAGALFPVLARRSKWLHVPRPVFE